AVYYVYAYMSSTPLPFRVLCYYFYCPRLHRYLHSFPTRRSSDLVPHLAGVAGGIGFIVRGAKIPEPWLAGRAPFPGLPEDADQRSEEHTSELQSRENLVCRLLLEKKTIIHNLQVMVANAQMSFLD